MSKWAILALLIFIIFLQYQILERVKKAPTTAEVYSQIDARSSIGAVRQLEETLTASIRANEESTLRLRKKLDELEQKVAALTPPPEAAATPAPSPSPKAKR